MVRSMALVIVVSIMVQILMQSKMLIVRLRELMLVRVVLLTMEFIMAEVLVQIFMGVALGTMRGMPILSTRIGCTE